MSTYKKPKLSISDQILKIASDTSCTFSDKKEAEELLARVSYYKIQEYLKDFYIRNLIIYNKNFDFKDVAFFYEHDRKISHLFFQCVTEIEVSLRNALCNFTGNDPFDYHNSTNLWKDKASKDSWLEVLENKIEKKIKDRKAPSFLTEHINNYGVKKLNYLPIWIALEISDFGNLYYLYEGLSDVKRDAFSASLSMSKDIMKSNLKFLNILRNSCAHNSKIINNITYGPKQINSYRSYYHKGLNSTSNVFCAIIVCYHFMNKISKVSDSMTNFFDTLEKMSDYSGCDFNKALGLENNWRDHNMWYT